MQSCLQHQVDWITGCIGYLRARGLTEIEPDKQIQDEWVKYDDDTANATLIAQTDSWFMDSSVPGKRRRMLSFAGGVGTSRQKCESWPSGAYPGLR
jgi:cyclohexanone monooxygenase/acetone monooxygenase